MVVKRAGHNCPFCTSDRPAHLLCTDPSPVSGWLEMETVNPVPIWDPQIVTFLDLFTSMYRNNGLPMTPVMTPTGTPVDPTTLPMQSHTIRNAPPNAADAGRRYLLSEPMNSLTICGATNPTNPMTPVKLTTQRS